MIARGTTSSCAGRKKVKSQGKTLRNRFQNTEEFWFPLVKTGELILV